MTGRPGQRLTSAQDLCSSDTECPYDQPEGKPDQGLGRDVHPQ
ncbi:MAG: hypothetical protein SOX22_02245 [Bacteroidaceae bacterium]|nr:hypothetical protein [Bacteroidaceae bacterium]